MRSLIRTNKILVSLALTGSLVILSIASYGQVKIGTNPTTIQSTSNLEVESSNNKKVVVNKNNGTVIIENTPSGAITDSIMTVDLGGNVRAINANKLRQLLGASGSAIMRRATSQALTPGAITPVDLTIVDLDQEGGTNLTDNTFTVKRAGVYTLSATITGLIPAATPTVRANIDHFIEKLPAGTSTWISVGKNQSESNSGAVLQSTVTLLDNANVGDKYRIQLRGCLNCISGNPDYTMTSASFYIFKNL